MCIRDRFCEAALAEARPGDTLWIQDYHLMLLPSMLREALPDASIGFFLHIPFPDYETFRTLPWRCLLYTSRTRRCFSACCRRACLLTLEFECVMIPGTLPLLVAAKADHAADARF